MTHFHVWAIEHVKFEDLADGESRFEPVLRCASSYWKRNGAKSAGARQKASGTPLVTVQECELDPCYISAAREQRIR